MLNAHLGTMQTVCIVVATFSLTLSDAHLLVTTTDLSTEPEGASFLCGDDGHAPAGCFRRSDTTMRSETPHYERQPPASRMAKDEGAGRGLYNTAEAATAFHVNRLDWVYSSNASWVRQCHDAGIRAVSLSINGNLADTGSHPATYTVGRARTVDGAMVSAPWMRTWSTVPYRGCINNPDYRAVVQSAVSAVVAAGTDAVQHDDWSTNEGSVAFDGGDPHSSGCYCSYCMAGFTGALINSSMNASARQRYNVTSAFNYTDYILDHGATTADKNATLRGLFVEYQQNSTQGYFRWLRRLLATLKPGGVPLGCNNGGIWSATTDLSCDFGMGELPKHAATPAGLEAIFRDTVPAGRQQLMTMPKEGIITPSDVLLTRWAIATAYALGGNMLAPWDVYLPTPSAARFWGSAAHFGDLYAFVRAHAAVFDAQNVSVPNELPITLSFELVHTGASGDRGRFNLPSDTAHPAAGSCIPAASLASCEYVCTTDPLCVAIYSDDPRSCCALHSPLKVINGTSLTGRSYLRRNCSFTPAGCGDKPPPFTCTDCDKVSIYARRGATATGTSVVGIHLVNFDLIPSANSSGTLDVRLGNTALFAGAECGSFGLQLLVPNKSDVVLSSSCSADRLSSIVTIPTPQPWAIVLATSTA